MNDINPLKQYFRRPAMYLKLPSGGQFYDEMTVRIPDNGELPIYPMTAIDEVTAKTPDALFNGSAVVEIIRSCVPNIINPDKLNSIDLDAVLIAIRAASVGSEMDIESDCVSCKETNKFGLNLMGLLASIKPGDYDKELFVGDLSFTFRPLSLSEINEGNMAQFEVQREMINARSIEDVDEQNEATSRVLGKVNELSFRVVAKGIREVKTPEITVDDSNHILDYLKNCDKKVFDTLRNHVISLRETSEIKPLKITCVHCQHEYEQPFTLNVSDFFE
jgi:hypothetical protein